MRLVDEALLTFAPCELPCREPLPRDEAGPELVMQAKAGPVDEVSGRALLHAEQELAELTQRPFMSKSGSATSKIARTSGYVATARDIIVTELSTNESVTVSFLRTYCLSLCRALPALWQMEGMAG